MRGVRLTDKKRAHLLDVYCNEGYRAAYPLAIEYQISPHHLAEIARNAGRTAKGARVRVATLRVKEILAEFKVGKEDLFHSHFAEHIKLRRKAIERLRAMGFGYLCISRAMDINEATVRYWANKSYRDWKRARTTKYNREKANANLRVAA
jgi:hypothetical protein